MSSHALQEFLGMWEFESGLTTQLLKTIPNDQYDFRPDPSGRSLGELAWHLAELEAIMSAIAASQDFQAPMPAGVERPRTVDELVSGYERVHREAVERVRAIPAEDLDREFPFFGGRALSVRQVLWAPLLHHLIHHRGQLMMMIRLAQAIPSRVYGPMREDERPARAGAKGD
jgi:uncharacterized damage-inducible protein DinB